MDKKSEFTYLINSDTVINGNLNVKGIIEGKNKREIFDQSIDISSDSNQDINSGIIIEFKPIENQYFYKMFIIINNGDYINETEFIYKNSISIISQYCNQFYVNQLSFSDSKLMIKLKSENKIDLKNTIDSLRVKIKCN